MAAILTLNTIAHTVGAGGAGAEAAAYFGDKYVGISMAVLTLLILIFSLTAYVAAQFLGSGAGHFFMTAIDADQDSNTHDAKFGNGNAIRVVGVHGWLLQNIQTLPGTDVPRLPSAAWARSLAQGMMPQDLDGNDVPTFDGL